MTPYDPMTIKETKIAKDGQDWPTKKEPQTQRSLLSIAVAKQSLSQQTLQSIRLDTYKGVPIRLNGLGSF